MYTHTQRSPANWLLFLVAAGIATVSWWLRSEAGVSIAVAAMALIIAVFAMAFQTLTISDEGDHLRASFGPLRLFGTRIRYRDITGFEQTRSALIDGWGIHYIPFRGWTLNLWGFNCVKLQIGGRTMRLGTDDAANLVQHLRQRTSLST